MQRNGRGDGALLASFWAGNLQKYIADEKA